jgi:hypothetical protein
VTARSVEQYNLSAQDFAHGSRSTAARGMQDIPPQLIQHPKAVQTRSIGSATSRSLLNILCKQGVKIIIPTTANHLRS